MTRLSPVARGVVLLALLAAAFTAVDPSAAFDAATLQGRDASADVVSDASAYHAISVGDCTTSTLAARDCTITITNKGASSAVFYATESPDSSDVSQYSIGGSSTVTSGRAGPSTSVSPGATTTLTARVPVCGLGCFGSSDVFFTVEGEKADTLSSIETKVKLVVTYT